MNPWKACDIRGTISSLTGTVWSRHEVTVALVAEQPPHPVPQGGTTLSPKGARVVGIESSPPSPPRGRGAGGEGAPTREWSGCYVTTP
jgi:hypothetical protein